MNIQNVNNANAGDPLRNTDILKSVRADKNTAIDQQTQTENAAATVKETQTVSTAQTQTVRKDKDVYETSFGKDAVQELTNAVQNMEEVPRQQVMANVSENISKGYYNSNDFIGNLAMKLINTGSV